MVLSRLKYGFDSRRDYNFELTYVIITYMSAVQSSKKDSAIKLRLQGKSYGEILKILKIPSKGTLSVWFRNVKISQTAKKRLQNNIDLARKRGLFKFNENRTEKVKLENDASFKEAFNKIEKISLNDLALIGAALYWAEGTM